LPPQEIADPGLPPAPGHIPPADPKRPSLRLDTHARQSLHNQIDRLTRNRSRFILGPQAHLIDPRAHRSRIRRHGRHNTATDAGGTGSTPSRSA